MMLPVPGGPNIIKGIFLFVLLTILITAIFCRLLLAIFLSKGTKFVISNTPTRFERPGAADENRLEERGIWLLIRKGAVPIAPGLGRSDFCGNRRKFAFWTLESAAFIIAK